MHQCILLIAHVLLSLFYTYYVLYNCTPYMATAITANAATAVSSTILRYCFVFIALHTYGDTYGAWRASRLLRHTP